MKVFVGLISSNQKLCEEYKQRRTAFLSKSSLPEGLKDAVFSVGAFNPKTERNTTPTDYFAYATRNMDAAMLVVDSSLVAMVGPVMNSFFTAIVEIPDNISNCQNFLGQRLSRPLKNFSFLMTEMQAADTEQAAILPIRNFEGNDLRELVRICAKDTGSSGFPQAVTAQLTLLKRRKRPRHRSAYRHTYIVDDAQKHFQYGLEQHSRLGSGPPHNTACVINGNFRFGKRIPSERHFNVSYGDGDTTTISGNFPNCHDEMCHVKATTHLNMFSNDFF